jgi:hypothetical protein
MFEPMNKALFFVIFSLFSLGLNAQNKIEEKAQITFEKTTHDFGKVYDGKAVSYEFVFTNSGKIPLILSNVQPACGCTVPEWPREPIMPGQKSKIKAIYTAGTFRGAFNKSISVVSNADASPIQLIIKGLAEDTPKQPQSPVRLEQSGGF